MKLRKPLTTIIILVVLVLLVRNYWRTNTYVEAIFYDLTNANPSVHSKKELTAILGDFEKVSISNLPKDYLASSKMKDTKYAKMVSSMTFYKIQKKDCYRKIVGHFRIKDFIAKDALYRNTKYASDQSLYWGIKPDILFKLMELKKIFENRNYNWNAIKINSGHRTPLRNEQVGGASKSRHIVGEAIDLKIGDIDRSGFYTEKDKAIVLDICEKELIRDKGGIGKYPGTRVIHIDTRGYKARWNTY